MKLKKNKKQKPEVEKSVLETDYILSFKESLVTNNIVKLKFAKLPEARRAALELYRQSRFVKLENYKGIVLPLM